MENKSLGLIIGIIIAIFGLTFVLYKIVFPLFSTTNVNLNYIVDQFDEAIERCQSKIIFAYPLFEKAVDISLFDDVVYNLNQVYKEQGWGGVKIKSFRGSHVVFSLKIPE